MASPWAPPSPELSPRPSSPAASPMLPSPPTRCRWGLTFAVPLVLGELEAGAAFTGNTPFGRLPANVSAAVVLVHAVHSF